MELVLGTLRLRPRSFPRPLPLHGMLSSPESGSGAVGGVGGLILLRNVRHQGIREIGFRQQDPNPTQHLQISHEKRESRPMRPTEHLYKCYSESQFSVQMDPNE